jgi:hypothetical protein
MNGDKIKIWKEMAWPLSRYFCRIHLVKLTKTMKNPIQIARNLVKIWTEYLPNSL